MVYNLPMKQLLQNLQNAIPFKSVHLPNLELTCDTCGATSRMKAVGYPLPQSEDEMKNQCVRFVLKQIYGEQLLKCDCLMSALKAHPIVLLYTTKALSN
jgi:hypothetical protein